MFYFNLIKEIKDKIDILEIISKYVKIIKKNNHYLGNCPFHLESNPSFYVYKEKKFFYCFGCKTSGDLIAFISKINKIDFKDAIKYILENYGKLLKLNFSFIEKTNYNSYKEIYLLNKLALKFFKANLCLNSKAFIYLKSRNVSIFLIKKFNIGFLDSNCEKFYNYLILNKVKISILKKSNLFYNIDYKINSIFSNRIIFSIRDKENNIIAFGGRSIDEITIPKYVNSKNSMFYQKKDFFFGSELLSDINYKYQDSLFISEGYFDFMALNSLGYKTISLLGSNINFNKIISILFSFKCLYFCLDSDCRGIATFLNSLEFFFLNFKGSIYYVDFFFFKDPFLYYENNSAHLLLYDIKNKKDAFEFFIYYYFSKEYLVNKSEYIFSKIFNILKIIFFNDYIMYYRYLNYISSVFNMEIYKIEMFFNNFLNGNNNYSLCKSSKNFFSINELEFFFCLLQYNKLLTLIIKLKIYSLFLNHNVIDYLNKIFYLYFLNGHVSFSLLRESFINDIELKNFLNKLLEINYFNNYFTCRMFVFEFLRFKINKNKVSNEKKNY